MGHEGIQGQVQMKLGGQVGEQHDASQGVQPRLIEVGVNAEAAVPKGSGNEIRQFLLPLGLWLTKSCLFFLLGLLLTEIAGADDFFRGGFFKGHIPEMEF